MACHCHNSNKSCRKQSEILPQEKSNKSEIICIAVSAILLLSAIFFFRDLPQLLICIAAYVPVGWRVWKEAGENILHGMLFDENILMAAASIGAFCIGEYPEAVSVMLLYSIGEMLQEQAVDSSRDAISALISVRPDCATLITADGNREVAAADVGIGKRILVRPGERIPLDGIVRSGSASVDTSPLTGESLPRRWGIGETALAGCICCDGTLEIEVTKSFSQSSVSRILALVEDAQENKAKSERFITRFAKVYTPTVCGIALLVAIVPPLMGWGSAALFIHKALAFLVISCPCALVISVPLSFFSGIGCASHNGILFKGGNYLERLAQADVAAFDKTGTLTKGNFQIQGIFPTDQATAQQILEVAAYCESQSGHPLAKAICRSYDGAIDPTRICDIHEIAGKGICAMLDRKPAMAGSGDLMSKLVPTGSETQETAIHVAYDNVYLGYIALADEAKPDAAESIAALRKLGLHDLTMLSGDRHTVARHMAEILGLDQVYDELLPEDKTAQVKKLKEKGVLLYVGDGINDVPVLATADIGIAMGSLGSDAAIEAADVVIASDELVKIPLAIQIARKTTRIARENIAFTLAIKVIVLTLSLATSVGLWLAVIADVGACMLAILNTLRAMRIS